MVHINLGNQVTFSSVFRVVCPPKIRYLCRPGFAAELCVLGRSLRDVPDGSQGGVRSHVFSCSVYCHWGLEGVWTNQLLGHISKVAHSIYAGFANFSVALQLLFIWDFRFATSKIHLFWLLHFQFGKKELINLQQCWLNSYNQYDQNYSAWWAASRTPQWLVAAIFLSPPSFAWSMCGSTSW